MHIRNFHFGSPLVLPVCITRSASQRAQPLESLTDFPINKKVFGPPNPWKIYCAGNRCDPNWV